MNEIRTILSPDRRKVVVQMVLNGEPGQWIEFDPAQLDQLIRVLKTKRAEMRGIILPN